MYAVVTAVVVVVVCVGVLPCRNSSVFVRICCASATSGLVVSVVVAPMVTVIDIGVLMVLVIGAFVIVSRESVERLSSVTCIMMGWEGFCLVVGAMVSV